MAEKVLERILLVLFDHMHERSLLALSYLLQCFVGEHEVLALQGETLGILAPSVEGQVELLNLLLRLGLAFHWLLDHYKITNQ